MTKGTYRKQHLIGDLLIDSGDSSIVIMAVGTMAGRNGAGNVAESFISNHRHRGRDRDRDTEGDWASPPPPVTFYARPHLLQQGHIS